MNVLKLMKDVNKWGRFRLEIRNVMHKDLDSPNAAFVHICP